ncbi:hypothetical protein PR048_025053, partial [Dryococelus australis]
MPFGMKNAPATFQCLMSAEVLTGNIGEFSFAYLDLNDLPKSYFGKLSIDDLGHVVSPEGNFPQQNSIRAIEEAEEPTNKRQLRQYLVLCNWLRDLVPNIAQHIPPLHPLLEGHTATGTGTTVSVPLSENQLQKHTTTPPSSRRLTPNPANRRVSEWSRSHVISARHGRPSRCQNVCLNTVK